MNVLEDAYRIYHARMASGEGAAMTNPISPVVYPADKFHRSALPQLHNIYRYYIEYNLYILIKLLFIII